MKGHIPWPHMMAWETLTCLLPLLPMWLYLTRMAHQSAVPGAIHRNPQVSYSCSRSALTMTVSDFTRAKRAATKQMNIPGNICHWDNPMTSFMLTTPAEAVLLINEATWS